MAGFEFCVSGPEDYHAFPELAVFKGMPVQLNHFFLKNFVLIADFIHIQPTNLSINNPDIDWRVGRHGDSGHDLQLANGSTAAVKFNHRYRGYLMIEGRKTDTENSLSDLVSDLLILTHFICDPVKNVCRCRNILLNPEVACEITVCGYISDKDFMRYRRQQNWGIGMLHYVTADQLRPISELAIKK